jgi:hypothetical protein
VLVEVPEGPVVENPPAAAVGVPGWPYWVAGIDTLEPLGIGIFQFVLYPRLLGFALA